MGTAISSVSAVMISVLMIDGIIEQLSVVYFQANMDGRRFGTPITTMYTIRLSSTPTVMTAASRVTISTASEPGCRL